MFNKKADLMKDVLSTIITIIGLTIIAFAAWKLYSVYSNQDATNAQTMISSIEGKINLVENENIGHAYVVGVDNWYVVAWNKADSNRPDKCYFKNCLCICKPSISNDDIVSADCQSNGYCRTFDERVSVFTFFNYEGSNVSSSTIESFLKDSNYASNSETFSTVVKISGVLRDDVLKYNKFPYLEWLEFKNKNLNDIVIYNNGSDIKLAMVASTPALPTTLSSSGAKLQGA